MAAGVCCAGRTWNSSSAISSRPPGAEVAARKICNWNAVRAIGRKVLPSPSWSLLTLQALAFGRGDVELGQSGSQRRPLPLVQRLEELSVVLVHRPGHGGERPPPLLGQGQQVPPPVPGIPAALGVAQCLQAVDQLDHVAAVDAQGLAQLLLEGFAARVEGPQDGELLRPDAPLANQFLEPGLDRGSDPGEQEPRTARWSRAVRW